MPPSHGGLHQRVAFRIYPVQTAEEESVEQPCRFYRTFWKYRKHQRAYGVILMDAAHLSQTFYLVCAELGLGAFFTAAINGSNVEEKLGLDGFTEGAVAICGCGAPAQNNYIDPVFQPYVPTGVLKSG